MFTNDSSNVLELLTRQEYGPSSSGLFRFIMARLYIPVFVFSITGKRSPRFMSGFIFFECVYSVQIVYIIDRGPERYFDKFLINFLLTLEKGFFNIDRPIN